MTAATANEPTLAVIILPAVACVRGEEQRDAAKELDGKLWQSLKLVPGFSIPSLVFGCKIVPAASAGNGKAGLFFGNVPHTSSDRAREPYVSNSPSPSQLDFSAAVQCIPWRDIKRTYQIHGTSRPVNFSLLLNRGILKPWVGEKKCFSSVFKMSQFSVPCASCLSAVCLKLSYVKITGYSFFLQKHFI